MAPLPPHPPQREPSHSAQGSNGASALSHLTQALMGSLYAHKGSKSTRALHAKVGNKVYADNRSTSRRSMRRTSGRKGDNDALVSGAADPLRPRMVSVRERNTSVVDANGAISIDLAHTSVDAQGSAPIDPSRRPTMLSGTQGDTFSDSIRSLRSKVLGEGPHTKPNARPRYPPRDAFDFGDAEDADGDFVDDDEFDEDDEDDPMLRRLRAMAAEEQDEVAYFSQRSGSFDFKVGPRLVLHPYGRGRAAWDCFMLVLITWMLVTTPFELSFRELQATTRQAIIECDYFLDCMFVLDIILNFVTAVEFEGRLHFSYRSIRRSYLGGWFVFDTLWAIPFYAMTGTTGADIPEFMSMGDLFRSDLYPLLRIFRLSRILSLTRIRQRLEFSMRISSSSSSLGGFVYTVLALSHLFSCMFAYLAFGDEYHLNVAITDHLLEDDSIYSKYIASSYWAMMTIATVGYGDLTVKTNAGRLFSICAMVVGGGIFAYGISNVVDLFQQLYVEETEHRHKMDHVNTLMHDRNLPRKLRDEIRASFFHLRKATRENKVEDHAIVQQMSRTMQSRVADLFCLSLMPDKMPTLAGCNAEFIHELYLAMEVKCYLPGEDIIRQDDYGTELYFLCVGHVQVFVGHSRVSMFGPNSCFGEFALMNPHKPRLATIQAVDFCETHCITRQQLLLILFGHPFMLNSIRQLVQLKQRKALAVLTDRTSKIRTLIQSLAGVWHTEGLQALLPTGMKIEDLPQLQEYSPATLGPRLASVRLGIVPAGSRRKSVNVATVGAELPLTTITGGGGSSDLPTMRDIATLRRRISAQDLEVSPTTGDQAGSTPQTNNGGTTARVRRQVRVADGGSEVPTRSDDRTALLLHQMNVMLRRQERLEQQVQQLLETRQHRGSVHVSFPTAPVVVASDAIGIRSRASITDLSKPSCAHESPL